MIESEIGKLNNEIKHTQRLLDDAYRVNIIPTHYRNKYAALFLYDWFNTGGSDDLDMALNMFVLEEIKEKLDMIIRNQSTIILNQRIMQAQQQKTIEQQNEHNRLMRNKLDQLCISSQEHNRYLSMIESNTAATAYFAAADYLK